MDKRSDKGLENDSSRGNARVRIQALAREILMNGSSLMSQAEAVAEAKRRIAAEASK